VVDVGDDGDVAALRVGDLLRLPVSRHLPSIAVMAEPGRDGSVTFTPCHH
jgi:hypothetical protein